MEPEKPEQPQVTETPQSSYNKKPLWQWITIYVVVGIVIYGLIYYLFIAKNSKSTSVDTTKQTQSQPTSGETTVKNQVDVILTKDGFSPQSVTISKGGQVTWINESGATATVHSAKHPTHEVYPPLNLGEFGNGQSLSLVFDTPGTYQYHNHLNASQNGTVVVQ